MSAAAGPAALARRLWEAGVAAADARAAVRRALAAGPPDPGRPLAVVAAGKAACAMAAGAREALGERWPGALVVTAPGYCAGAPPGARVLEAEHPVPGPRSLAAGEAVAAAVAAVPPEGTLLFLLSGGASALLEFAPAGVGPEDYARLNRWLLAAGLDIGAMNAVRRAVSALKGGRLALRLRGEALVLAVSDVPGEDPAVIGSGPLAPPAPLAMPADLPDWVRALARRAPPLPAPDDPAFARVRHRIVASNATARAGALAAARAAGLAGHDHGLLAGEAAEAGRRIGRLLAGALPAGVHVWGGEAPVRLPPRPGRGGRCRHLALAAALELQGRPDVALAAGGTDGRDGTGDAAGAVVDGATVARGRAAGLDPGTALARADAGAFLEAAGAALPARATGTNVMDLVVAVAGPVRPA